MKASEEGDGEMEKESAGARKRGTLARTRATAAARAAAPRFWAFSRPGGSRQAATVGSDANALGEARAFRKQAVAPRAAVVRGAVPGQDGGFACRRRWPAWRWGSCRYYAVYRIMEIADGASGGEGGAGAWEAGGAGGLPAAAAAYVARQGAVRRLDLAFARVGLHDPRASCGATSRPSSCARRWARYRARASADQKRVHRPHRGHRAAACAYDPELSGSFLLAAGLVAWLAAIDWRMALACVATVPAGLVVFAGGLSAFNRMYAAYVKRATA